MKKTLKKLHYFALFICISKYSTLPLYYHNHRRKALPPPTMYYAIRSTNHIHSDIERGFSSFETPPIFKAPADYLSGEEASDEFSRFFCQAVRVYSIDIHPSKYSPDGYRAPSKWEKIVGFFIDFYPEPQHNEIKFHEGYGGWVLTHGTGLSCYELPGEFATDSEAIAAATDSGIGYAYCAVPRSAIQRKQWGIDRGRFGQVTHGYGSKTRGTVAAVASLGIDLATGRTRYLISCTSRPQAEGSYR